MTFEMTDLREAAERYAGRFEKDHGSWTGLAWRGKEEPLEQRLDDLVEFLGTGRALRFKGGGEAFRRIYRVWLRENRRRVEKIRGRVLFNLGGGDFDAVFRLSSSFRKHGAPPTTYGKALHFILPETLMLWDQKIVRDTYNLGSEPEDYVRYQRFGQKLLHHVVGTQGIKVLERFEREHGKSTGYLEPMTMILDHLAYYPKFSARAVNALGGHKQAFSD